MPNNFAPIGVSTYGRLAHLKQTVQALKANKLANESELYIFSDAPRPGDEEKVAAIREYLRTIDGFKAVHIVERMENSRVDNNRGGMRLLLDQFGKMIFLEEDIVTAPSFLSFMNYALNEYKNDARVFAVNAYTPPIQVPEDYKSPVILLPRFAAWGFGIWKEKFDEIVMDITPDMYRAIRSDIGMLDQYCRGGGDITTQLWLQAHGFLNALDVRIDYTMFVNGRQYVLCPSKSLAHSTGCDGSGEHWSEATSKNDVELDNGQQSFASDALVQPDERIIRQLQGLYRLSIKGRLARRLMDAGGYQLLKAIQVYFRKLRK